ncbi:hypothetical protein I3760_07G206200 [Carya illinoinensis]|nr:hypothetical protein I3760_07G206200 [Carya illinoinensis]
MRIKEESNGVSASRNHLVFAYYVTGHGFGHATRVVEVVRHLILAGHDVHVVTGAPEFVFTSEIQSPRLFIRKVLLDCGAVQADALTVDRLASLEKYSVTAVLPRASILETEVAWLNSIKADLVVSDVVPVACRAAADAGIRSVCVTNFSWDFIYAEYVMDAGNHHRSIVWEIAEDYSHCEFLIRLPGYCPMPAFRDVIDVPLVVRRLHRSRKEVRKELEIGEDVKLVILNFGGQPAGWNLKEEYLPSGWLCLVCGASDTQDLPPNFVKLAKDAYTPDLMAASDCMLGKIGYGTVSEALAYKLPFVFVRRDYFNEEPFLRNMLEYYQGGVEMIRRDLLTGHWKPYLERAISLKPCYEGGINGGEVAAQILQETAIGKNYTSDKLSGARRLRDAIILGYQLQRVPGRDILIPEWYASAENELGISSGSPTYQKSENSYLTNSCTEDFEILHGDPQGFPDTIMFLKSLAELDVVSESERTPEKRQIRERKAAAGLFNWEKFLEKYADHNDSVTVIDPKRNYGVTAAAKHPIYENFRVKAFKALLTSATSDEQLTALGELLYQCHYSYSACGLGSDGTDRLAKLVQAMQHSKSDDGTLYGAKITGGGSGGTVCVVGKNCLRSSQQIIEIQQRYKNATGYLPFVFEGSSPGAGRFGHLKIRRRTSSKLT